MKIHTGFSASKNGTDLAILLLRIATGALMLFYGTFKIINGHGYIREFLAERGLPEFLWFGVPLAEVIVPLLLIMGVLTPHFGGHHVPADGLYPLLLGTWGIHTECFWRDQL